MLDKLFRMRARPAHRIETIGVVLLAALLVCGCGRGKSGKPDARQARINVVIGERLGVVVAEAAEPGEVILVHLSQAPGEAEQWAKGLRQGLGSGFSVTVMGPDLHPDAAQYGMGGNPPLQYALQQYPDAVAMVTTLPVGAYERPRFSKNHPPIYALNWTYLPDSAHLFKSKDLVAGVFERPDWDPAVARDPSRSPEEVFDSNYVVVTPENFRELAVQF